jgi:plastocyanin
MENNFKQQLIELLSIKMYFLSSKLGISRMIVIALTVIIVLAIIFGVYFSTQAPSPSSSQTPSPTSTSNPTPSPTVIINSTSSPTSSSLFTPTPSPITTFNPTPISTTTPILTSTPVANPTPVPTPIATSTPIQTIAPTPTPAPTVSYNITIYAGVNSQGTFGFGNNSNSIQSPGPSFTFKVGSNVTLTLVNTMPTVEHNWAMVDAQSATANVVFGARVNIIPGGGPSETVTFSPTVAGNYYYICQVVGHFAAGMWGTITVTP